MKTNSLIKLLIFSILFLSCSKEYETKILTNPNLTYTYRDNLREENFQITLKGNDYTLTVFDKLGNEHKQSEKIKRVLKIEEVKPSKDSKELASYIINTDLELFMVVESYNKTEIFTYGLLNEYEDPNKMESYSFSDKEVIYAQKINN